MSESKKVKVLAMQYAEDAINAMQSFQYNLTSTGESSVVIQSWGYSDVYRAFIAGAEAQREIDAKRKSKKSKRKL